MIKKMAALILAAVTGLSLVAAAPSQASLVGCLRDASIVWNYNYDTGNWRGDIHRATGCGEATVYWQGWYNTPDDCTYLRIRVMDANGNTVREGDWHDNFVCNTQLETLMRDISGTRYLRIEARHATSHLRAPGIVPSAWLYY